MDEHPQRRLALELRYAIDVARRSRTEESVAKVKRIIERNPHGSRSRHVEHNLGEARLEWLYEVGLLQGPTEAELREMYGR